MQFSKTFSKETWNFLFRSFQTPSYGKGNSFWTPTTPTPSHALRPSLSLHNLESKTFTEVLIPTIRPPLRHEVSPPEVSPRSPSLKVVKFSPTLTCREHEERRPVRSHSVSEKMGGLSSHHQHQRVAAVPTVISPPGSRQFKTRSRTSSNPGVKTPPSSKTPSPQSGHYKSFTPIRRPTEISENVIFMECS